MQSFYPLISCICATSNRPEYLQHAIDCFKSQNYPNKELVISFPKDEQSIKEIIELARKSKTKIIQIEREQESSSLEDEMTRAISSCFGEYVCIWNDDHWYHPSRISYQFNRIQNKGEGYQASILTRLLLYDSIAKQAYYSFSHLWESTLLCSKTMLSQHYLRSKNKKQDTPLIQLLSAKKQLLKIDDAPFLYIYVQHDQNEGGNENFESLLSKCELLAGEDEDQVIKYLTA